MATTTTPTRKVRRTRWRARRPVPLSPAPARDVEHLLRRATYGPTPASLSEARRLGAAAWVEAQLRPASLPDPVGDLVDAAHPGLFLPVAEARVHYADKFWVMGRELVRWRLHRSAWSSRQLHEVMSDLVHNLVNVPVGPDNATGHTLHRYHHDVVRRHCLGAFADLLVASAEHPAMLHYLNANTSTRTRPNENYARELLELHSVGVGAHTEEDVRAVALLLTGWRTRSPWQAEPAGVEPYAAWFDTSRHHVGPVTVLGRTFTNGAADGRAEIRGLLRWLAARPATARHVCRRLATHFVADEPPTDLVDRLAQVYLSSGTRLDAVLRALFADPAFEVATRTKVRRPLERYLATLRLLVPVPRTEHLAHDGVLWQCPPGHVPLSWGPPDGYPDTAAEWRSAGQALAHVTSANQLLRGWIPVTGTPLLDAVLATDARDVATITDEVARRVLLRPATSSDVEAVRRLLAASPLPPAPWRDGWDRHRAVWWTAVLLLSHPRVVDR
ncbi:DUF1800 domain-containing protein [Aquipuribacter nitratireducens]|uniref:DUF1800 domain-containing protein n=1 Tax=Aquipuribacter nitratireducens TaxID=650104 RepID=A0ABW0GQX9_9MICO